MLGFYDDLVKLCSSSPATEPLACGVTSEDVCYHVLQLALVVVLTMTQTNRMKITMIKI